MSDHHFRPPRPPKPDAPPAVPSSGLDRRRFFAVFAGFGLGATALPELLWAQEEAGEEITKETLAAAEKLAGLELTDEERDLMLDGVREARTAYEALRTVEIPNSVTPALVFDPVPPGVSLPERPGGFQPAEAPVPERPESPDALAFLSVAELGRLLRAGQVTSVELTEIYLERLRRYDPLLECVVSFTEERALEAARRADRELAAGEDRGPLHGIPWGAKDLLAARGYRTTWGAEPYKAQVIDEDATAVARLEEAGAVLVAKLTLGALAWGDVWFGGKTRNPWNPEQGSSGSSAGSASAAAAGLTGFNIGSETWGSIVSPSTRCGATGLRPTFGRVSRHGAMALSWSMDKLGPIGRTVEDCALVFQALLGPDGLDTTVVDRPFRWDPDLDVTTLRVGYVKSLFEREPEDDEEREWMDKDRATLETLERLGVRLIPLELPDLPTEALSFILSAEAAAAFDELTRSGRDDLLVRQIEQAWPNVFRQARMIPAVEYLQANRVRTLLMQEMVRTLEGFDVYVCPSFGGDNLLLTNLTGHPSVVLPNGFREDGTPTSITFMGDLYAEGEVLALAHAYQRATDFHHRHPDLDTAWKELEEKERQKALEEQQAGQEAGDAAGDQKPDDQASFPAGEPRDLEVMRRAWRAARTRTVLV